MRITVLGATGATGRHVVTQALRRGHTVVALARDPDGSGFAGSDALSVVKGDVGDPASIARSVFGADAVVSVLGRSKTSRPDVLTAGAKALVAARRGGASAPVVALSAYGTGRSAAIASGFTRALLALALHGELEDKGAADDLLLDEGATLVYAPRLTNGGLSGTRRLLAMDDVRRRTLPGSISRASVAALLLDEAEKTGRAVGEPVTELVAQT